MTRMRVCRALIGAALFMLTASTASAQGHATTGTTTTADNVRRLGVLGGFEFESDTGFGLRGDMEIMPLTTFGGGTLKLLGSVGWTYYSPSHSSVNVLRFIPGVRYLHPLQDKLGVYGDGGLGLYYAHQSIDSFYGGGSDNEVSLLIRLAGGLYYEVSPSMRVVGEIGVMPHFGDLDITPFTLLGGVSWAF